MSEFQWSKIDSSNTSMFSTFPINFIQISSTKVFECRKLMESKIFLSHNIHPSGIECIWFDRCDLKQKWFLTRYIEYTAFNDVDYHDFFSKVFTGWQNKDINMENISIKSHSVKFQMGNVFIRLEKHSNFQLSMCLLEQKKITAFGSNNERFIGNLTWKHRKYLSICTVYSTVYK